MTRYKKPRIGISWKGGYKVTRKDLRSLTIQQLKPLLDIDAEFFSLQYTKNALEEVKQFKKETEIVIHHHQEIIDDYSKTAEFIQELDLVVSVCTSIIHLSGAIGVPCYVLVPEKPAWRYGVEGEMLWYGDHLKLFRQEGDWSGVINQVKNEICKQYPKIIAA